MLTAMLQASTVLKTQTTSVGVEQAKFVLDRAVSQTKAFEAATSEPALSVATPQRAPDPISSPESAALCTGTLWINGEPVLADFDGNEWLVRNADGTKVHRVRALDRLSLRSKLSALLAPVQAGLGFEGEAK